VFGLVNWTLAHIIYKSLILIGIVCRSLKNRHGLWATVLAIVIAFADTTSVTLTNVMEIAYDVSVDIFPLLPKHSLPPRLLHAKGSVL
jgi:hypothetical protein